MPRKKKHGTKQEHRGEHARRGVRSFWSGTISFGLVNVPVNLFPATRSVASGLRMLDRRGTPLSRRYYCPEENRDVHPEHLLRGYEIGDGEYVIVKDEELEALEPKKSREIDLRRFVDLAEIPPAYFERPYFLTPGGDSNKAYRLLADVIEHSGRAGVATFVMRGREYLVAILAEHGILRAQTMRFADELRTAADVGLPDAERPDKRRTTAMEKAITKLNAKQLSTDEMRDETTERLRQLVEAKRRRGEAVYEAEEYEPPEEAEEARPVDLLETIRQSLRGADGSATNGKTSPKRRASDRRTEPSKEELYEKAKKLDIPGRSGMNKQQLLRAIHKHG